VVDTHCHLTFPDFAADVPGVLARAAAAGVTGAITISTTTNDCLDALAIATAHEHVWSTAGVHPLYADKGPHHWPNLRACITHPKCVAWGELGLDEHYNHPPASLQHTVLADQLAFIQSCRADGIDRPIVLHCRKAFHTLIPILRSTGLPADRFVFHCFTGTPDDARLCLDFGALISFTGVVTYRNAREVAQAFDLVPLDRLLIETDAPFLSPEPVRGARPCEPAFARHTADFLAARRHMHAPDFEHAVNDNTHRFFGVRAPVGLTR
jgi:TatD DNase family protein